MYQLVNKYIIDNIQVLMNCEFWRTQMWALFETKEWFYLTVLSLTNANRKSKTRTDVSDVGHPAGCLAKVLISVTDNTTIYYCVTNLTTETKHKRVFVVPQCLGTLPPAWRKNGIKVEVNTTKIQRRREDWRGGFKKSKQGEATFNSCQRFWWVCLYGRVLVTNLTL